MTLCWSVIRTEGDTRRNDTEAPGKMPEASFASYFTQQTTASRKKRAQPGTCLS